MTVPLEEETQDPGKKPNLGHPTEKGLPQRSQRAQSSQRRETQDPGKKSNLGHPNPRPRHRLRAWGTLRIG
jgi:hypothetical protein